MPEEWLLFINEAINSLSRSLIRDRNINACPYCDSRIVKMVRSVADSATNAKAVTEPLLAP